MSVRNPNRSWRHVRRAVAVALVATAATVSTGSARGRSDQASLEARIAASGATGRAAAVPATGQVLGGFTSQDWPVVIKLSKNHKRIARVGIGLDMTCTSGVNLEVPDGLWNVPISANGKVHAAAAVQPVPGSNVTLTGGMTSFSGKLVRKHATFSGVWQLRLTFSMSNGQTDQCDSGRVTFTAAL